MQSKMDEIMDELKKNRCVIEHKNTQPTIKYFNSLASNLMLYEMQQHKAWFDNVYTIYDKLAQPVLAKDPKTNQLVVNLHPAVFQLIRESETMMKLNLGKLRVTRFRCTCHQVVFHQIADIPHFGHVVVHCREIFMRAKDTLGHLISSNNSLRNSLDMVLFNISRPIFRKIDIAFKPGLTRIQWLSMDLDMYFEYVEEQLIEANNLVKRINNIKRFHIEEIIKSIKDFVLIELPKEPLEISLLLEQNINHRKKVGMF